MFVKEVVDAKATREWAVVEGVVVLVVAVISFPAKKDPCQGVEDIGSEAGKHGYRVVDKVGKQDVLVLLGRQEEDQAQHQDGDHCWRMEQVLHGLLKHSRLICKRGVCLATPLVPE